MKLAPALWCKIQEALANLKCPHCFSTKVKLDEKNEDNASCKECECSFQFDPDISRRSDT